VPVSILESEAGDDRERRERRMKVVVLNPMKVFIAGAVSCLLITASVLGALALWDVFDSEPAEAYGADGVGAKRWYFAEGYTGDGFEEWILVYNPPSSVGGSGNLANMRIVFFGPGGYIGEYYVDVSPGARISLDINTILQANYGYSGDVSISADSNYPLIAERALYFNYKGQWNGGSQVLGYNESANE